MKSSNIIRKEMVVTIVIFLLISISPLVNSNSVTSALNRNLSAQCPMCNHINVSPSNGTIYNPFGVTTAVVDAYDEDNRVFRVKIWAENVPSDIYVVFDTSVVYFQNHISTNMTIYGRTTKNGTYTFAVIVEWMYGIRRYARCQVDYELTIVSNYSIDELSSWTKNPSLVKDIGLWDNCTSRWSMGLKNPKYDANPPLKYTYSNWDEDGLVSLFARDGKTLDASCECSLFAQGKHHRLDDLIYGTELEPVKNSEIEDAFILLTRSDFGVTRPIFLYTAGNIIDIWMTAPDGSYFGIDIYFETKGINNQRYENGEYRWTPSNISKVYSIHLFEHPEFWMKNTSADGKENWIIDLKAIIERASVFTGWNLSDFEWRHIEFTCESATVGLLKSGAAWQTLHYFDVKIKYV